MPDAKVYGKHNEPTPQPRPQNHHTNRRAFPHHRQLDATPHDSRILQYQKSHPKNKIQRLQFKMSNTDSDNASSVGSIHEDASEPDTTSFKDLFSDKEFSRVEDMISHNRTEHNFDLSATIKNLGPGTSAPLNTYTIPTFAPYPIGTTTNSNI
jgi:hypothetical protein